MNFSLIIPTIGKSPFLPETVRSGLNQTTPFDEILLFGNGVDPAQLRATLGPGLSDHIRIVCRNDQLPPHASWNAAIAAASHDYVVILGDDDLFDPSVGETLRRGLVQHPFVAAGYRVISSNGSLISKTKWSDELLAPVNLYELLFPKSGLVLLLAGIAFARAPFFKAGGFPPVPISNSWMTDTECWVRLANEVGGLRLLSGHHWRYRINPGQMALKKSMDQFASELRQYSGQHRQLRATLGLPSMTPGEEESFCQRMILGRYLNGIRNRSFNGVAPGFRDLLEVCRLIPLLGPSRTLHAMDRLLRLTYRYYFPAQGD